MTYVWMVDISGIVDFPKVHRYELIEKTATGYRVKFGGGNKIIREAIGRRFFTHDGVLEMYLRKFLQERVATHERLAAACRKALTHDPKICYYVEMMDDCPPRWAKEIMDTELGKPVNPQ